MCNDDSAITLKIGFGYYNLSTIQVFIIAFWTHDGCCVDISLIACVVACLCVLYRYGLLYALSYDIGITAFLNAV